MLVCRMSVSLVCITMVLVKTVVTETNMEKKIMIISLSAQGPGKKYFLTFNSEYNPYKLKIRPEARQNKIV